MSAEKPKYQIAKPFHEGAITHPAGVLEYDGEPSLQWKPLNKAAYEAMTSLYEAKSKAAKEAKRRFLFRPPTPYPGMEVEPKKRGPGRPPKAETATE